MLVPRADLGAMGNEVHSWHGSGHVDGSWLVRPDFLCFAHHIL